MLTGGLVAGAFGSLSESWGDLLRGAGAASRLDELTEMALEDPSCGGNPIEMTRENTRALFEAAGRDARAVTLMMEELKSGAGFTISQGILETLRSTFASGRASEEETSATIRRVRETTGELICPHTAVGVKVAEEHLSGPVPMVTLATAHPAKFPDAVEAATGIRPALPPRMADLFDRPERVMDVPNDLGALEALIRKRIR